MKFVQSKLAKKLIIILVALMIFNVVYPPMVSADTSSVFSSIVDVAGGIIFLPLKWQILAIITNINLTLNTFLFGVSESVDEAIKAFEEQGSEWSKVKASVSKFFIGPEHIFSNQIPILNVNFFETLTDEPGIDINGDGNTDDFVDLSPGKNVGNKIRDVVASIYVILRNICALIMLAGLIYTGIRIIVTSNIPTKKMQYLSLLEDWVMGMVLLIFSHIIMIIILELSDLFTGMMSGLWNRGNVNFAFELAWGAFTDVGIGVGLTYTILYGYITWLVVVFTVSYFKRFFWMVVLTIFAPVISIMYAFGQQTKQIYSRWLKEYIMTVLTQPFHMLVYYVLFMIPIEVVNPSGESIFGRQPSLFELMYALFAISFIRPAEKYLRELFGFDKGIASAGSYDSGAAPIKAAIGAAAQIAATVYGGPAAGQAVAGITGALDGGDKTPSGGGVMEDQDDYTGADRLEATKMMEDKNEDNIDGKLAAAKSQAKSTLGRMGALGREEKSIKGRYGWGEFDTVDGESAYNEHDEKRLDEIGKERKALKEQYKGETAEIKRLEEIKSARGTPSSTKTIQSATTDDNSNNKDNNNNNNQPDNNFETSEGKDKGRIRDHIPIVSSPKQMGQAMNAFLGKGDIVDGLAAPYEMLADAGLGKLLKGNKFGRKILEGGSKLKDFAKAFEERGGFIELYKGFNSVRDTMYINGAPGDWKDYAAMMEGNKKNRHQQNIANFSHNPRNIDFMLHADNDKILNKYKKMYADKPVELQIEMATEQAKKKLKELGEAYVPLGVKDVEIAYSLKKDQNQFGYTPRDAIIQSGKFEKFNTSPANISTVNNFYGTNNNTPVSFKIPNAKEYYYNGITDINTMIDADRIAAKLSQTLGNKLSEQMRKDIATTIAKKGGVSYGGNDANIRRVIDELTKKGI